MSDKQKIQIALKPLFLTTQEAKGHEQVYNAIIQKNYPNLKNVNQEEFKKIKSRLNEKNAQKELKNVILKIAFDEIININLNYDIAGYDFEDQMQDVVLFIEKKFKQFFNIEFISSLKFYVQSAAHRCVITNFNRLIKKNLDVQHSFNNKFHKKVDVDSATDDIVNYAEYSQIYEDFREVVKKNLENLSPKHQKILSLYYGLNGNTEKSISEIAKHYNLTRSMIHKHITDAIHELSKLNDFKKLKNYKKDGLII